MKIELRCKIPSKKNSWHINRGKIYQKKQDELDDLIWEIKSQHMGQTITDDVSLLVVLWDNNRQDLSNQISTICDALEAAQIVKNDRQIKKIEAQKIISKEVFCEIKIYATNT